MKKLMENNHYLLNKNVTLTDYNLTLPKGKIVKVNHIDTDGFLTIETDFNKEKIIFNSLKDFFLSELPENYEEPESIRVHSIQYDHGAYLENTKEIVSEDGSQIYFPGQKFIVIKDEPKKLSLLTKNTFGDYVNIETTFKDDFKISKTLKEEPLQKWSVESVSLKERDILQNIIYTFNLKKDEFEIIVKSKHPIENTLIIGEEKSKNEFYQDILLSVNNSKLSEEKNINEKNYLIKNFCEYIHTKQDCFISFKKFIDLKNKQLYDIEKDQIIKRKNSF